MPFDGSGNFNPLPPPVFPAVPDTVILASYYNQTVLDLINNGLSQVIARDGQSLLGGNLNFNGFKPTNVADGFSATDLVTIGQLAAPTGTSLIGHNSGFTLAEYLDILEGNVVPVMKYIPKALHAAIRARTCPDDLTSYIAMAIAEAGPTGKVFFELGDYRANIVLTPKISLIGAGIERTKIRSFIDGGDAITFPNAGGVGNPQGSYVAISDMTVSNATDTYAGNGIRLGAQPYVAGAELAGYVILERVRFDYLNRGVAKLAGNLDVTLRNCHGLRANFHIWGRSANPAALMHAGCLRVDGGDYNAAALAHCYLDNTEPDGGQVIYTGDPKVQGNPGWCFYFKSFSMAGPWPVIEIGNTWNETNFTASSVTIDGVSGKPGWLYAKDTDLIRVTNSTPGPVTLENSTLQTEGCGLDQVGTYSGASTTYDNRSDIIHREARADNAVVVDQFVESVAQVRRDAGNFGSAFWMPHRGRVSRAFGPRLYGADCQTSITLTGFGGPPDTPTVVQLNDGSLFNDCGEITIPAVGTFITPGSFSANAGEWVVMCLSAKVVSGNGFRWFVTGAAGLTPQVEMTSNRWKTILSVGRVPANVSDERFWLQALSGASTIRLGGYFAMVFPSRSQAMQFMNSGIFPA